MVEVGRGSWVPRLARGETIAGHIRNFEDAVHRFLEVASLKSTAAVPIFVDGHWWGFIGFDSCQRECEWSLSDLDTPRTLADLVGAAVGRSGRIKSLAEASHIIERSPTILYRLGPEKPSSSCTIEALARTDMLIGLANRTAFIDRLSLEFAGTSAASATSPFSMSTSTTSRTSTTRSDTPIGDTLLRAVADRISACVREADMVARLGGDEFAMLQDEWEDLGNIEALAGKICEQISAPFVIDGNVIHTTASIGVVPYREDIPDADAMMSKADLALYRAKEEGRNQYRFHVAELDHQVWERVATGRDLRLALERDEFELYYQPQADLVSGRVIGLEALIRWNHPAHGPMPPDEFIHIAETTGSIVSIGRWVVDRVCNQIRAWRDQGVTPPVIAINLSGAQFKLATNIGRTVADAIARAGIGPEQLELELTETVLMETAQKHNEALTQLRRLGVRLTIDDFGTGYSSLDYLRSFQPSRLKIDRRFVGDATAPTMPPLCAPLSALPGNSASGWSPKAWRPPDSATSCSRPAAAWRRATISARPSRSKRRPRCCGSTRNSHAARARPGRVKRKRFPTRLGPSARSSSLSSVAPSEGV
jgi:diguanylate cyclase (GGDEF)-like protein